MLINKLLEKATKDIGAYIQQPPTVAFIIAAHKSCTTMKPFCELVIARMIELCNPVDDGIKAV
jgi:hypothetical protein